MKGKRTDAVTKAIIIEAKINSPDLSSKDISNLTGGEVSKDTVCDILNNDLPQVATQSSRIASLIDSNNKIGSLVDERIQAMLTSGETVIRLSELTGLRDSTFKQNQLLTGSSTENSKITIEWTNES